jgi:hypothetical protein
VPEVRLTLVIGARNETAAGFAQAAESAKKFNATVSTQGGIGDLLGTELPMGIFKAKFAVESIKGALEGASAIAHAWRGEWQAASDNLEKLPLGIGGLSRSLKDLLGDWTGINEEIAQYKAETDEVNRGQVEAARRLAASLMLFGRAGVGPGGGLEGKWTVEARIAGIADEVEHRKAELRRERDEAIAGIEATAELSGTADPARVEGIKENVRKTYEQKFADWLAGFDRDAADKKVKAEREQADALARVRAQLSQRTLLLRGETLQAELEEIREHYRELAAAARSGEERIGLEKLRRLDELAAQARSRRAAVAGALSGPVNMPLMGAAGGGLAQATFDAGEAARVLREEERIRSWEREQSAGVLGGAAYKEELAKQTEFLRRIADGVVKLATTPGGVAGWVVGAYAP